MKKQNGVNVRKAAMIGCGFVGSASAFALMQSGLFSELVMIDADKNRAEGEALDISHGVPFARPMKIYAGDYDDIVDASVIIITAGANIFPEGVKADFWEEFKKELEKDSIPPLTKMMLLEPQMTAEDMQKIQCPALITIGEFDLIDEDHTRMIAENIPQGQMLIVPGEDHGSFVYKSPKIGEVILAYFKEQKY